MFVTEKLVYLQMEKTASTHIAHVLDEIVGGEQHVQHIHLTRNAIDGQLPIDTAGRLVVASIRNPWSWYLSLWAYGCRGGGGRYGTRHRLTAPPPTLSEVVTRSFTYSRAKRKLPLPELRDIHAEWQQQRRVRTELWKPLYNDANDTGAFQEWLRLVFDARSAHELFPEFGTSPMRFHSGYMTFRYFWNFARDRGRLADHEAVGAPEQLSEFDRSQTMLDDVVVLERLEPELVRVLEAAGYDLTLEQRSRLRELCVTRTNESPHLSDGKYFDDGAVALVGERDRFLVERFQLEPPL